MTKTLDIAGDRLYVANRDIKNQNMFLSMSLNMLLSLPMLILGGLGPWEIALIVLAILLLFGAKRIPELARGLGKGIREFKDASREIKREIDEAASLEDDKRLNN